MPVICFTAHVRFYSCCTALACVAPPGLCSRALALQPYFPVEAAKLLELLAPPAVRQPHVPDSRPASAGGPEPRPTLPQLQAADAALQAAREAAAAALAASIAMQGLVAGPDNDGRQEAQLQEHHHQQQQQQQTEQHVLHSVQQREQQHAGCPPTGPTAVPLQQQQAQSVGSPIFAAAAAGTTAALAAGGIRTPSCSSSTSRLPRTSCPSPLMGAEPALPEQDIAPGVDPTVQQKIMYDFYVSTTQALWLWPCLPVTSRTR